MTGAGKTGRMRPKRAIPVVALAGLLFLLVNYTWSQAALAGAMSGAACPPQLVDGAEVSVSRLLGQVTAKPWVYCLDRPAAGLSVDYATTRFAPLLPAIIILGPLGQTSDVVSHEYVHAEVAYRTSALLRSYRIPTWFDEGLAMQLDARDAYDRDALAAMLGKSPSISLHLETLSSPSEFFGHGERSALHYAFAKCVVGGAIADKGIETIRDLISEVGWGSSFPVDDFQPYAAACLR